MRLGFRGFAGAMVAVGLAGCGAGAACFAQQQKQGATRPRMSDLPDGSDRVTVDQPASPLRLAEPYDLRFRVTKAGLAKVMVGQRDWSSDPSTPVMIRDSERYLAVTYDRAGEGHVSVVPIRLGKLQITLFGVFVDGGMFNRVLEVSVEPSKKVPERLIMTHAELGYRDYLPTLLVSMVSKGNPLLPMAKFDTWPQGMPLDPHFMQFRVKNPPGPEIARVDAATGKVMPVHPGHALVTSSYGGKSTVTCVVVAEDTDSPKARMEHCMDMAGGVAKR